MPELPREQVLSLPAPRVASRWTQEQPVLSGAEQVSEQLLAAALLAWAERDGGGLLLLDRPGRAQPLVRWTTREGAALLGYSVGELTGRPLAPALVADPTGELPPFSRHWPARRPVTVQRRDGTHASGRLSRVPEGEGADRLWVLRLDGTAAVVAAQAAEAAQEPFRTLARNAPVAVLCAESGSRLTYVNDRFCEIFGRSGERLVGTAWLDQVLAPDRGALTTALAVALDQQRPQELSVRVRRADGTERLLRARLDAVPAATGDRRVVGTLEDLTERHAAAARWAHHASHDPLTGLLNRHRLLELLTAQIVVTQQDPGRDAPALLFLDLDDFKQVNDTLGHAAGDALLLEVSRRLTAAVRDGDVVCRLGGDEFALLCLGVRDDAVAGDVAHRLLTAASGDVRLGASSVPVSASLGIVRVTSAYQGAEDVLRDADIAMYQAKSAGKDRWTLYDEHARQQAQHRQRLARDLRTALDQGCLTVAYQPIVDLGVEPASFAVEALARWTHAQLGPVPPAEFVAVAEENGLIERLGAVVLRQACWQLSAWREEFGSCAPRSVSVNISALQLQQPGFQEQVLTVLRETGLPGPALCLELTETVVLDDVAHASEVFAKLRAHGVRIAIDDFGTGYSSLSVVRQIPLDQLKIDRSLLADLAEDTHDPVVAAVIALGHAMNLAVVAEGVETTAQENELRRLGCRLAQGFLFGRPMTPDQIVERLAQAQQRAGLPPRALSQRWAG